MAWGMGQSPSGTHDIPVTNPTSSHTACMRPASCHTGRHPTPNQIRKRHFLSRYYIAAVLVSEVVASPIATISCGSDALIFLINSADSRYSDDFWNIRPTGRRCLVCIAGVVSRGWTCQFIFPYSPCHGPAGRFGRRSRQKAQSVNERTSQRMRQ